VEFQAFPDDSGRRLDRVLRKGLRQAPLSWIHRLLREGKVRVNGQPAGPNFRLHAGDVIDFPMKEGGLFPDPGSVNKVPQAGAKGTNLPPILWEGPSLLILNKPPGLPVHGPLSLEDLVCSYLAPKLPPSLSFRPGPLHRLDQGTSGIIVFSKTLLGAQRFSTLLQERKLIKRYLALVEGLLEGPECWEDTLFRDTHARRTLRAGGENRGKTRAAETRVLPLETRGNKTLIGAEIRSGRTHQIRAQAALRGHPLAGDLKYGGRGTGGFFLHAWELEFPPEALALFGGGLPRIIRAPLPPA